MDRMITISIERGSVGELHDAARLETLSEGDVDADCGFYEAGNLSLERADLVHGALLLGVGNARLPAEGEGVDDHAASVIGTA